MSIVQEHWKEVTDDNGDVWVLVGDAQPGEEHSYLIGNLEDTCGECHDISRMIVNAPVMYAALKHIAEYANTCNAMTPAAGYRRIVKLAEQAADEAHLERTPEFKLDLSLPEAADGSK